MLASSGARSALTSMSTTICALSLKTTPPCSRALQSDLTAVSWECSKIPTDPIRTGSVAHYKDVLATPPVNAGDLEKILSINLGFISLCRPSERCANVRCWPSTSLRCAAAIFPEPEVERTGRGHRENDAHDPLRKFSAKYPQRPLRCVQTLIDVANWKFNCSAIHLPS
jgi:hypothetical protein